MINRSYGGGQREGERLVPRTEELPLFTTEEFNDQVNHVLGESRWCCTGEIPCLNNFLKLWQNVVDAHRHGIFTVSTQNDGQQFRALPLLTELRTVVAFCLHVGHAEHRRQVNVQYSAPVMRIHSDVVKCFLSGAQRPKLGANRRGDHRYFDIFSKTPGGASPPTQRRGHRRNPRDGRERSVHWRADGLQPPFSHSGLVHTYLVLLVCHRY